MVSRQGYSATSCFPMCLTVKSTSLPVRLCYKYQKQTLVQIGGGWIKAWKNISFLLGSRMHVERTPKGPRCHETYTVARFLFGEPSLARASKLWWLSREQQSDSLLRRLLPIKAQQQVVTLIGRLSPEWASEVGQRNQTWHLLLGRLAR